MDRADGAPGRRGFFFLALIINQSALVGQTTVEGVLEFPKNDIRDLREVIFDYVDKYGNTGGSAANNVRDDIIAISLDRKNAVVDFTVKDPVDISGQRAYPVEIHYNNGVTVYDETIYHY